MIAFMQTLLPLPVAPAMSRWGIFAEVGDHRLAGDALAQGERELRLRAPCRWNSGVSITLRSVTTVAESFGTSMPTIGCGPAPAPRCAGSARRGRARGRSAAP